MNAIIMTLDKRIDLAEELEQQCRDGSNKNLVYDNIDPKVYLR